MCGQLDHYYRDREECPQKMRSRQDLVSRATSLPNKALETFLEHKQPETDVKKSNFFFGNGVSNAPN